jgi:predicted nucleic acid-binding protein
MAVIRAVLDTSIYVSALLASKGASGRILEAGFERRLFVPVTSPAILDELIDVIARPAIMRDEDLLSLKVLRVPGHRPVQMVGPQAFLQLLKR